MHQARTTFVEKDLQILKEKHAVREVHFRGLRDMSALLHEVRRCDIVFCWFAKLHALVSGILAKALRKKLIVISGGDDVSNGIVNGGPYGLCASPFKRLAPQSVFRLADRILAVSRFNLVETLMHARADPEKTLLVYHGFDPEVFARTARTEKDKCVITVSTINRETVDLKGLRLFVETARFVPEVRFILIGPFAPMGRNDNSLERLQQEASPNVSFPGGRYGSDLVEMLRRASVYVQASQWESFGCALAEAMLCECVPVVFRGTALPEVVGDCGYYIERLDARELAAAIREALRDERTGRRARERIASVFPLEKRREALLEAVESVAQPGDAKVVRA